MGQFINNSKEGAADLVYFIDESFESYQRKSNLDSKNEVSSSNQVNYAECGSVVTKESFFTNT